MSDKIVFCQLCGKDTHGWSKTFHHSSWSSDISLRVCRTCLDQKPKCRVCGIPMESLLGNVLCSSCLNAVHNHPEILKSRKLCLSCKAPLKGKYFEYDGVGPYCGTCAHRRIPCSVCGAPLTDEFWRLSDERLTCGYCHSTAIYLPLDAEKLYKEIKKLVGFHFHMQLNIPTGLALVDVNQMREIIRQQNEHKHTTGRLTSKSAPAVMDSPDEKPSQAIGVLQIDSTLEPERTLGIYTRRGFRRGIYIQTGLPRLLFLQVTAHEYAHAWQGENCPVIHDSTMHEGFAEWLAYHVIGFLGYTNGQQRMSRREDLYGKGLRLVLQIENVSGTSGVIATCQENG